MYRVKNFLCKIIHLLQCLREFKTKERRLSKKGKYNSDKTVYVIRCNIPECGFFALLMFVLDHLAVAESRQLIPVVDMENYKNLYSCDDIKKTRNVWEYYFRPVSEYSLDMVYRSKNVILSEIHFPHYKALYYNSSENKLPTTQQIGECYRILNKYIFFNPAVQKYLTDALKILSPFKKILGIHIRGTDMYTEGKHHPVPSGKTRDIEMIKEIIAQHEIDGIFVCTDTQSNIDRLKDVFGNLLVYTDSIRQKDNVYIGIHKDVSLKKRPYHEYFMGLEVLRDMYLLSKCDVLLCGPSNVAFFAMIYNGNKYEKVYYM